MTITLDELLDACKTYDEKVERTDCYAICLRIVDYTGPYAGAVAFLGMWYPQKFSTLSKPENLKNLEQTLDLLKSIFRELECENIKDTNFDDTKISKAVMMIYSSLSMIPGVEQTGASKIMHLLNPELFVIWDGKIREHYQISNDADAADYLNFLGKMQKEVKDIMWDVRATNRTLAKAIDEYNFVKYTLGK